MKPSMIFVKEFLNRGESDALLERIRSEGDFKQNYIQLYGRKAKKYSLFPRRASLFQETVRGCATRITSVPAYKQWGLISIN